MIGVCYWDEMLDVLLGVLDDDDGVEVMTYALFRNFFETEKQAQQTFSLFGYMGVLDVLLGVLDDDDDGVEV